MQTNFNRSIPQLKTKKRTEQLADANVEEMLQGGGGGERRLSANDYYSAHAYNTTGNMEFEQNCSNIRGMSNHSSIRLGDARLTYKKSFQQEVFRMDDHHHSGYTAINKNVHEKTPKQFYMDYKEAIELVGSDRITELENTLKEKVMQKREQGGSQLRKAFKIFDRQMNGYVDLHEFKLCMQRMNLETSDVETLALFGSINRSCSGRIDYYEFVNNFMEVPFGAKEQLSHMVDQLMGKGGERAEQSDFSDEQIQAIYNDLDVNGDNQVTIIEFGELLEELGKELTPEEVAHAFRLLDTDASDYIEFREFLAWWRREKDSLPNSRRISMEDGILDESPSRRK